MTKNFILIGRAEGISFLLLLGVAMPLKYWLGIPEAVKYTGWAHGVLFIAYLVFAYLMYDQHNWKLSKLALAILAALFPFGPFLLEKKLTK